MYLSVRKIWLAVEPVDMRMGLNGLSQLVQNHLGHAIGSQCAYVFGNRSRTRLNGLDPQAWLKDVLEKLPTCPNSKIRELLPLKKQANTN